MAGGHFSNASRLKAELKIDCRERVRYHEEGTYRDLSCLGWHFFWATLETDFTICPSYQAPGPSITPTTSIYDIVHGLTPHVRHREQVPPKGRHGSGFRRAAPRQGAIGGQG